MNNHEVFSNNLEGVGRETVISTTNGIVNNALSEISDFHKDKAYHSIDHTQMIMRRATKFLEIVRDVEPELVTERDFDLVLIAGAYHDIYQDYDVIDGRRVRKAPYNEEESAHRAAAEMAIATGWDGSPAYSDDEIASVMTAIHHTVPAWDVENRTVYQPELNAESSILSRAIAYADIGTAAIDGPDQAIRDADRLFLEDNVDLVEKIASGTASEEDKAVIKAKLVGWTQIQEGFITGRRNRLDLELEGLSDELKIALKDRLFVHYEESIIALQTLLEERKEMEFEELIMSLR